MDALSVNEGRLRALFAAGLAVTSELSLDALLHRLVEAAAELTGARYAALGVIDASGSELEQFITHGIDDDLRAEIGTLPRGRGILGVLISEAKPLRLHDLAEDPRSVGFPPAIRPCTASSACRSCCAASPTATSTSPRSRAARTSRTRTRSSSRCSPARLRWRSRTRGSTRRRRAGRASCSRSKRSETRSPPRPISTGCSTSSSAACASSLEARVVALALPGRRRRAAVRRRGRRRRAAGYDDLPSDVEERRGVRAPAQRAHRLGDRRSRR